MRQRRYMPTRTPPVPEAVLQLDISSNLLDLVVIGDHTYIAFREFPLRHLVPSGLTQFDAELDRITQFRSGNQFQWELLSFAVAKEHQVRHGANIGRKLV